MLYNMTLYSATHTISLLSVDMNQVALESKNNLLNLGEKQLPERRGIVTEDGMLELGKRVERFRKQSGITQIEMAKTLGITQAMYSRIECGDARLHGELVIRLTKIFGVSSDELLGIKIKNNSDIAVPRRWVKRLGRIDELPKRDQDALARIIDAFLERTTRQVAS